MFDAGASAYVLKSEAIDDLVAAIAAVLRGERFVSPAVAQQAPVFEKRSARVDKASLSEREIEVLRRLAEGQRIREIADALQISAKTVETYRSRLMLKLGIDNLPGLVKFAIRAGIASPRI
jgi:DNA-binding NarL/FixJ family response regulator